MHKYIIATVIMLLSASANANREITLGVGDSLQFSQTSIEVAASCSAVTVKLPHTGTLPASAMGHNWVLTKSSEVESVATAGMAAGFDNNYVPVDDSRVIANTKIIGGGESASVSFSLSNFEDSETYTFFCSFPGHWGIMNGTFSIR